MPREITEYDLLFSCPGDVFDECNVAVNDAVESFNRYSRSHLSICVNLVHWSTNSYPQSGDAPQALLNTQIVDSSDAAIAVFWKRFGTPTDKYSSGTEEEIERLLNSDKQVFLYFFNKPVPPSQLDDETAQAQRKQVNDFRKKYASRGLYCDVSSAAELKEQLYQHLLLHFKELPVQKNDTSIRMEKSALKITSIDGSKKAQIQHLNLLQDMDLEERRQTIVENIAIVQSIALPKKISIKYSRPTTEENAPLNFPSDMTASILNVEKFSLLSASKKEATIPEVNKSIVMTFCQDNELIISDEFWNLGGLEIEVSQLPTIDGIEQVEKLVGDDTAKKKYKLIWDIAVSIAQWTDTDKYYRELESIPYLELVIRNEGKNFDEDIEILLFVARDSLMTPRDFPVPYFELEEINDGFIIDNWLLPVATADIGNFEYSNIPHYPSRMAVSSTPFLDRNHETWHEKNKEIYYESIENLFEWDTFFQGDSAVIKLNVQKLNQFRAMHFPARLFFKSVPGVIHYSITAKYTTNIITGEIMVHE